MQQRNRFYYLRTRSLHFLFHSETSHFHSIVWCLSLPWHHGVQMSSGLTFWNFYKIPLVNIYKRSKSQDLSKDRYPASSQGSGNTNILAMPRMNQMTVMEFKKSLVLAGSEVQQTVYIKTCVDRVCCHDGIGFALLRDYCSPSYEKTSRWGST